MHRPFTRWTADTQTAFLMALKATGQARKAAEAIGRSLSTAYRLRSRDGTFRGRWVRPSSANGLDGVNSRI